MKRYAVSQFDSDTYVVMDTFEKREICVCGNYEGGMDAGFRARQIASVLNKSGAAILSGLSNLNGIHNS